MKGIFKLGRGDHGIMQSQRTRQLGRKGGNNMFDPEDSKNEVGLHVSIQKDSD
jgi:hypothetical protein